MNVLSAIGLVVMALGFLCCVVASALYEPSIQRYLEKFGKAPAFFLFSWSGVQDYFSARQIAKKWGHNPAFLKRYGRLAGVGFALFLGGALLVGLGQFV
jgi:hypothetical protein